jgi:hypothetical protein
VKTNRQRAEEWGINMTLATFQSKGFTPGGSALRTVATELSYLLRDIHIAVESVPGLLDINCEDFQRFPGSNGQGDRYWIPWTEHLGAWVSADGYTITLIVSVQLNEPDLDAPLTTGLISVITGACLNLQNQVAIHANSVCINQQAIAFVGYSGMGKSTLSAFCAAQGAEFITDDVFVVNPQGLVQPGIPRLKLYPHTGESFGLDASQETNYKIYYHPDQFGATVLQEPVMVGTLYLLAESENGQIYTEQLPPTQALFELLTHSYYASNLIPSSPSLLDAYIRLVSMVPVKKLCYPRDFALLPDVYTLIQQEAGERVKDKG